MYYICVYICVLSHCAYFTNFHSARARRLRETEKGIERQTKRWDKERRKGTLCQREPISSSAGTVSQCRQSGYKQKMFSPLTSSTGPSVGRRHRNAYSPGVTATVCHQSVRLTALPADNASTRAQLKFITEVKKSEQKDMMKYTHQHCKSFHFNVWRCRENYAGRKYKDIN